MIFHVLTLFPEMVRDGMNTSIIGRAMEKGLLDIDAVNIRDFAFNKHQKVDDYPYGGGAGMLMQAEPVYLAWESVAGGAAGPVRTIYLTPQGKTFRQAMAREFAAEEELIFLCGHYEGIDERVLEEIVTDPVSIGDYVLTGGELPAMVMMDAIARMVPGVLTNVQSGESESFSDSLLEYPQYSRPEIWHGKRVPEVLLSGHHGNVDAWRRQQSVRRTYLYRPDLLKFSDLTGKEWNQIREWRREDRDRDKDKALPEEEEKEKTGIAGLEDSKKREEDLQLEENGRKEYLQANEDGREEVLPLEENGREEAMPLEENGREEVLPLEEDGREKDLPAERKPDENI